MKVLLLYTSFRTQISLQLPLKLNCFAKATDVTIRIAKIKKVKEVYCSITFELHAATEGSSAFQSNLFHVSSQPYTNVVFIL